MWSEKLIELTKNEAYPGAMMKSLDGKFGMMSSRSAAGIEIVDVEMKNYMPVPTDKVIATFKNLNEMIAAGWVID